MRVSLTGKTLKGKNKLQRDGNVFKVLFQRIPSFDKDKDLHFCLQNVNNNDHLRWFKVDNDPDIIILEEK